jgi:D-serine deaminase-like pyridoxal phosphate-dependent protein
VDPASPKALALARRIAESPSLTFDGILTHSGHAYHGPTLREVAAAAEEERSVMAAFAERLRQEGIEVPGVSVGSTPALSVARRLDGATEIRPGNYCFHDYMQVHLGSCQVSDCAATVLASVVSSRPSEQRSVVDAGALALSKDTGPEHLRHPTMGEVFADYGSGILDENLRLTSLSQEHGILSAARPVGSRVRVLPNHSCLTAAQFDEYAVVRGEEVVDRWKIWRGR